MDEETRDKALFSLLLWDKLLVQGAKCADEAIEDYMDSDIGHESEAHIMAGFESASRSLQQYAMNDLLAWDLTREHSFIRRLLTIEDGDLQWRVVDRQYLMTGYYERIAQNTIHDYTSEHNDLWKEAGINNNIGNPPE